MRHGARNLEDVERVYCERESSRSFGSQDVLINVKALAVATAEDRNVSLWFVCLGRVKQTPFFCVI